MDRATRLFRTTAFRLALAYAALFALSTAVLFAIVYWAVADYAEDQLKDILEAEAETLATQARLDGVDALAATLRRWEATDQDRPASYLLLDTAGGKRAGDLPLLHPHEGWFEFVEPEEDDEEDSDSMLGLGTPLPGGGFLIVAEDAQEQQELAQAVGSAFAWAGGISLALAVLGGLLTSAAFLHRLEGFNRTAARIIDGQLGERMPRRGADDEFDRLAANLNAMLDRIQSLMEGMRQVSSDVAHDLRTPLARLRQGLETARRTARNPAAYEAAVERALAESDEILSTFGALLRIAQIEAGTRRAGFAPVDLSAVFETIAETYAAVAEDNGQSLVATVAPGIAVRGDRELLTQMLANLVENAIRHTPRGSVIRLALAQVGERPVGTVADDGPGIPPEARGKVFRRFFRLEASRTTAGSGLGLSLVGAVADLHEITLDLADAGTGPSSGPGLVVTLRFPPPSAAPFTRL